jgi:hypothetical protein
MTTLWDYEINLVDLGIDVPAWIDQDIDTNQIAAILQGGCASGAYMPAVTYHKALATMTDHGDEVLELIDFHYGEIPQPQDGTSWAGIAVHYLSIAVELWAMGIADEALEKAQEQDEEEE